MNRDQKKYFVQEGNERFNSVLEEITYLKDTYVVQAYSWYRKHQTVERTLFHISSILIIGLSVNLPLLVAFKGFGLVQSFLSLR